MKENQCNMSEGVRSLMNGLQDANPDIVAGSRMTRAWNKSVDQSVLNHTCAVYVVPNKDASEVVIYIDSSIWVTELNLQVEVLRNNLNMALKQILEEEGQAPNEEGLSDSELIKLNQRVKKLRFALSKKRFAKRPHEATVKEQLEQELGDMNFEVVPFNETEEAELKEEFSEIEDPKVREALFKAAKAGLELRRAQAKRKANLVI